MTRDRQVLNALMAVFNAVEPLSHDDRKRVLDAARYAVDTVQGGPFEVAPEALATLSEGEKVP